jgi:hypothetical protein
LTEKIWTLGLVALVLAFAVVVVFVAVFTVISFFPGFEALLPHSAKVLQPLNQYCSIFINNDHGGGLYPNLLHQTSLKPCQ